MSRTPTHHRVFALSLAVMFFILSLASGVFVIMQLREDSKTVDSQAELIEQLSQANSTSNDTATSDQSDQSTNESNTEENKLEGTQLADYTPGESVDGLRVIDLVEGTGDPVQSGATITAHYTGALVSTGVIFQSSLDSGQPFTSPLSGLIEGWQEGIPGMKPGGKRRLIIPAEQAYGSAERPGIPANSDLVFDIELISVDSQ